MAVLRNKLLQYVYGVEHLEVVRIKAGYSTQDLHVDVHMSTKGVGY